MDKNLNSKKLDNFYISLIGLPKLLSIKVEIIFTNSSIFNQRKRKDFIKKF